MHLTGSIDSEIIEMHGEKLELPCLEGAGSGVLFGGALSEEDRHCVLSSVVVVGTG